MAQFNADILLNADVRKALRDVNRLEGGIRSLVFEAERFENKFKQIAQGPTNKVALAQQRQLAGAIKEQNKLLAQQITTASQLGAQYDVAKRSAVEFLNVVRRIADFRQKALPGAGPGQRALPAAGGSSQKLLPAAGGTSAGDRAFERAAREAARTDAYNAAVAENVRAANALTAAIEDEVQARNKAATQVNQVTRATAQTQKLLPGSVQSYPRGASPTGSGSAGAPPLTATSRFQQKLQAEVDRQIRLTGKLNQETAERVAQYNKAQQFEDRLIKSTGRLSTERNKQAAATKKSGGRNRLGSALVGGAFPALFGGGPGAILGGFAGELVGPLGGVVGSALGSQLDAVGASAIKLGQALDDVNPDVNRLISAIGLAGTETGKLIQSIERVEGAQVAQAIAAEQMAALVGTDGVQALKDAGDAATELGQEASRAFTALAVALAPALEAVSDFLAKNITEQRQLSRVDPGFLGFARGDLADRVSVQNVRQDFSSGAISEEEARKRLLDIVKEIEEVERRIFDQRLQSFRTLNDSYEQVRLSFELSQQELEVARLGGDLKNDAVYAAEQQNIKLQFAVQYQQLLNEAVQTEADRRIINLKLLALENKELAALANLENARNRALTSAAKSVARAPQSRELQLRQQILRVEQDLLSLQIEGIRFAEGEAASLVEANVAMQERLDREVKIIELQREQALAQNKVAEDTELINQLYDKQLEKAKNTLGAEFDRNVERLRAIKLERELLKLSLAQEENQVSTGLNRSIEDVQRRIDSPFGGDAAEMLELQIEQTRRYTDALEPLEEQLKQIEARRNSTNDKTILENLRLEEESVNNRIQAYKNLLPVLDQVEQQELQLQQTLQKIQPITDALANGFSEMVRGLIDGTQSVEEAFANMLKNMGNALIQEGTRMIAQYIAIGIARAFATGTSPSLPGGGGFGQNSPQLFTGGNIFDAPFKRFEGGGYTGNAPRSGGLDGRGGFMAMMHPQETVIDHRSAMNRYPSGGNQIPTFNLETTVINGVEYATVDQVRAMGKQAAREGASGGHARSMTTLKNSRSQRSKLGMR